MSASKTPSAKKSVRRNGNISEPQNTIEAGIQATKNLENIKITTKFELPEKHQNIVNTMLTRKTRIVFISAPAGTAKTYMAVLAAIQALQRKYVEKIVYTRSVVESASKSMGFLPGEADDKFSPWVQPLIEKIEEICDIPTAKMLKNSGAVVGLPVNFCRGLTFADSFVIIDEAQNMTRKELTTLLTRFGEKSTYVILGDPSQADIRDSGFYDVYNAFEFNNDAEENGIHCFELGEEDILRSEILKFIVSVLDTIPSYKH